MLATSGAPIKARLHRYQHEPSISFCKMAEEEKTEFGITVKWSGKEYAVESINATATVADLKERICGLTGVKPNRQKLLGLKCKGKIII